LNAIHAPWCRRSLAGGNQRDKPPTAKGSDKQVMLYPRFLRYTALSFNV
jgi:hypothetical protein